MRMHSGYTKAGICVLLLLRVYDMSIPSHGAVESSSTLNSHEDPSEMADLWQENSYLDFQYPAHLKVCVL